MTFTDCTEKASKIEIVGLPELLAVVGASRHTVRRLMRLGTFPKPLPEHRRGVRLRWDRAAVEHWLATYALPTAVRLRIYPQ
jgi:predicted DNA-binding transcriptional regulator AlpA